jgi:hypothetical protein
MTPGADALGDGGGRPPSRPQEEILRDLELERARLVAAIDQAKLEAQALKARLPSKRTLMIAAGALVGLMVLRWALKRR